MKFFEQLDTRPSPMMMLEFVKKGGEIADLERQWMNKGFQLPKCSGVLDELDTVMPLYVDCHKSILSEVSGRDRIVYAGRDAEVLYDIAVISQEMCRDTIRPKLSLLPASGTLINKLVVSDKNDKQTFLNYAELKPATFEDSKRLYFIDSGFRGTIAESVRLMMIDAFGSSEFHNLDINNNFRSRLVSRFDISPYCSQQIKLNKELPDEIRHLPRLDNIQKFGLDNQAFLAVAMQNIPRFNSTYFGYRITDKQFQLLPPDTIAYTLDCDNPDSINPNLWNPLAALATMHRVTTTLLSTSS